MANILEQLASAGVDTKHIFILFFFAWSGFGILTVQPFIRHWVPHNYFVGFTNRKTRSSNQVWYIANEYFGRQYQAIFIRTAVAALVLLLLSPFLSFVQIFFTEWLLIAVQILIFHYRMWRYKQNIKL